MTTIGAILLLFGGMTGLLASWNAVRPQIDSTRWYSPSWLPAMVVSELAPLFILLHVAALGLGVLLGGLDNVAGTVGAILLMVSAALLVWAIIRSVIAVARLRRHVAGRVPSVRGRARLTGIPVDAPDGVAERFGVHWRSGLTLDLTRPDDRARDLPVMVYVHGGGWTGGDPQRQARDMYHALALDGWAVLAIRYPFTPNVSVERQVEAVKTAVRWAREELGEHGIDATHVVLAGGSAGAHLAVTAAMTASHDVERVDAVVGLYGVYDMANRNQQRAHWDKIRNEVMLERASDAPNRYDALSPLTLVDRRTPPMLIVHGTRDSLVPIGEARQFVQALEHEGRPVDFIEVFGAQHAFDALSSPVTRATAAAIRDWLRSTVLEPD